MGPNIDTRGQSGQEAVNQAILMQLASITKRLDGIEQKNVCKKSVDSSKIKGRSKSSKMSDARHHAVDDTSTGITQGTKSSQSVPTLITLRQDKFIQSPVDERLKELSNIAQGTDQKLSPKEAAR